MNPTDSKTTASWIAGLMRENYDAVGFIPEPAVARQYLEKDRFVIAHDERGRQAGYLLHGRSEPGRTVSVAQHCILGDLRRNGYGETALDVFVERMTALRYSRITLRCAIDLESLDFWQSQGFILRDVIDGGKRRDRRIARLYLPLA